MENSAKKTATHRVGPPNSRTTAANDSASSISPSSRRSYHPGWCKPLFLLSTDRTNFSKQKMIALIGDEFSEFSELEFRHVILPSVDEPNTVGGIYTSSIAANFDAKTLQLVLD